MSDDSLKIFSKQIYRFGKGYKVYSFSPKKSYATCKKSQSIKRNKHFRQVKKLEIIPQKSIDLKTSEKSTYLFSKNWWIHMQPTQICKVYNNPM